MTVSLLGPERATAVVPLLRKSQKINPFLRSRIHRKTYLMYCDDSYQITQNRLSALIALLALFFLATAIQPGIAPEKTNGDSLVPFHRVPPPKESMKAF